MSPRKQPNEAQTELVFVDDRPLISDEDLKKEINRLRTNSSKYMRRGAFEAAQKANLQLDGLLDTIIKREANKPAAKPKPRTKAKPSPRKKAMSLRDKMQEFFDRTPSPTYLEASVFVASERKRWSGTARVFLRTIEHIAKVSQSTVCRFIYAGKNLTPEAVAEISKTTMANKSMWALNNIAHLPRDVQHLPDAWMKVVEDWVPDNKTPVEVKPFHPQATVKETEKYLDKEKAQVLAREDYHKIARIIGAQNNELRLKIKEVIQENHKSDLQTQVDAATTMNHILKELQGVNARLDAQAMYFSMKDVATETPKEKEPNQEY